jgi:TolB-like protein/Flp pilus assembly protein TadD
MTLLEGTLERPAADRRLFLQTQCADNPALFDEVWRRVQAEQRMNGFLLDPLLPLLLQRDDTFQAGDIVNDRFRIVRTVAHGGMAIVYEAWDLKLDKRLALKCARLQFRRRLPPEVRNATEITHPNICRVFEIHTTRRNGIDIDFLTMEFVEGQTLAQHLLGGPLPAAPTRAIARQVCEGLAEAHRRGIIHGDLKANNVIVTASHLGTVRAVITDFGLARGLVTATATGPDAGTPDYMAPELWSGAGLSIASDIYALGVLLFELTHGHRPSQPPKQDTTRATGGRSHVHRRWDRVIARCLAEKPEERYERVEDVIRAIRPAFRRPLAQGVVAAILVGVTLWAGGWLGERYRAGRSVAVVPFTAESLPAEQEYLTVGLTDSLIHTLAQFPGLNVIAQSSSRTQGERSLEAFARDVGASLVVRGRIRRAGDRLMITAEVVDPVNGAVLWGSQYDATSMTLASIEAEIARRIGEQVGVRVTNDPIAVRTDARAKAYELVLRGQYQRRLYSIKSKKEAIGLFEQALVVDPQFALAHAELANTYRLLAGGGILDPAFAMPEAQAAAQRALAIDPNLAEAHAALGDVLKDQWKFEGAEREYQLAIALKPSLADAHMGYGILLSVTGRYPSAVRELATVRRLDPVGLPGALHAAAVHYNGRQYTAALRELQRAEKTIDPSAASPRMWKGMVLAGSGRFAEALVAYDEAFARNGRDGATRAFYVYALAKSGARDKAQSELEDLIASGEFVPLTALAVARAGLGQLDQAIALLQEAYTKPDPILQYLKVESHLDVVKDRPEYIELATRLNLP